VLSGNIEGALYLWDISTGRSLQAFAKHKGKVNSVCMTTDGDYALSASSDGTVKLWKVSNGRCLRTLHLNDEVNSVCLSQEGEALVVGCADGSIAAFFLDWDLEERHPTDWDNGAQPFLDSFIKAHCPYTSTLPTDRQPTEAEIALALTRVGPPIWSEQDVERLMTTLACAGYGWLRPEGVRRELWRLTALPIFTQMLFLIKSPSQRLVSAVAALANNSRTRAIGRTQGSFGAKS
jgi:hypothetical protein